MYIYIYILYYTSENVKYVEIENNKLFIYSSI